MKILALDTSGMNCTVSLLDETKVIAEFSLNIGTTHSQTLLPMIDIIKDYTQIELKDIDVIACSIGPGSFTGLRIGLSTVKGFAVALEKNVIGVPTLLGLAYNVSFFDGVICSVLDAKNNNVYAAVYETQNGIPTQKGNYITEDIDFLVNMLKTEGKNIIFVGDGAVSFHDKLISELGDKAKFAPLNLNVQLASSIGKAALDRALNNDFDKYDTLNPLYLKKSQAERTLDENKKV